MTQRDKALAFAQRGFYVFPLDGRIPRWKRWPEKATRDPAQIEKWWTDPHGELQPFNVGISCGSFDRYGQTSYLLALDVDVKNGRDGRPALFDLDLQFDLTATYTQTTASGGQHVILWSPEPIKNAVDKWPGIDVRGRAGFIIGYEVQDTPVLQAPAELVSACLAQTRVEKEPPPVGLDSERAVIRGMEWAANTSPAIQGQGGDFHTFQTICTLKDIGVPCHMATHVLVASRWNARCEPPWDLADLERKVQSVFLRDRSTLGHAAPENDFQVVPIGPDDRLTIDAINQQYAWVALGGTGAILWETRDANGANQVRVIAEKTFHDNLAPRRPKKISRKWMFHPQRRSYRGVVFAPGEIVDPGFFNLWRGFVVQPAGPSNKPNVEAEWALKAWAEHLYVNVASGDQGLGNWVKGWIAHMFQKPQQRPDVALVLRGPKGAGKSTWIGVIMQILGHHAYSTSDGNRSIGSQFNAHLEQCLLLVLEEAFWPNQSSDNQRLDGLLKDLITRDTHNIERKYHEVYSVAARNRVCILGNERWMIPASHDERRYTLTEVRNTRQNDKAFWGRMVRGMNEYGGNAFLLRDLLTHPLRGKEFRTHYKTKGLVEQKQASLQPFEQWWLDSLIDGSLLGFGVGLPEDEAWPQELNIGTLRLAYGRYAKERNIRARLPADVAIAAKLKEVCPGIRKMQKTLKDRNGRSNLWQFPPLGECREAWDNYMGGEREWD